MTTYTKKWESLGSHSERLKVPGGWIVRSYLQNNGPAIHQIFVEDPGHSWRFDDEENN